MNLIEKVVKPGIKIELVPDVLPDDPAAETGKSYQSQVTDMYEDGRIEIYMPIEQGRLILLQAGSRIDVYFYSTNGIYECSAIIKERCKKDSLYFIILQPTSELKKYQRREYYRYSCSIPVHVRKLSDVEQKWMAEKGRLIVFDELPLEENTVIDISGGGMQFTGKNLYEINELLYAEFVFGKEYQQCLKVLERNKIPDRVDEYRYRLKFLGMERQAREGIIQNIFVLERMKRTKRKNDLNLEKL